MLTTGVDLAAEPERTALATLAWTNSTARIRELVVGVDDALLLGTAAGVDKVGIDCPLGWPDRFVDFLVAHRCGHVAAPEDFAGRVGRRSLVYRVTDLTVLAATGIRPLSVAADRIGHPAMRCASLLARLAGQGHPVDRAGTGLIVEVYPAGSLHRWGLRPRGYKGADQAAALGILVDQVQAAAPWLDFGGYEQLCRTSHDAFDAVLAALTARAAALGLVTTPSPEQLATARTEGWIALPTTGLDRLRG